MACHSTVTFLVLLMTQFCSMPTYTLPDNAQAQFWGWERRWTVSKSLFVSGWAVWRSRILVVQLQAVMCLLVPSPERGCVPWSVLFFDIYVATDPAFQEAGIQQLLQGGSSSIVNVCLGRQKSNSFKPGSQKLSGKLEKCARAT